MDYSEDPLVNLTIMALIVVGELVLKFGLMLRRGD